MPNPRNDYGPFDGPPASIQSDRRTLAAVLYERYQKTLPTEQEVFEYFGMSRPALSTAAELQDWNRRFIKLLRRFIAEKWKLDVAPREVGAGAYRIQ